MTVFMWYGIQWYKWVCVLCTSYVGVCMFVLTTSVCTCVWLLSEGILTLRGLHYTEVLPLATL